MQNLLINLFILCCSGTLIAGNDLVNVDVNSQEKSQKLLSIKREMQLDLLKPATRRSPVATFHVDRSVLPRLMKRLAEDGMQFHVVPRETWERIVTRHLERSKRQAKSAAKSKAPINDFASHKQINNWIASLPSLNTSYSVVKAGRSYEGKEVLGLKISTGRAKKAIIIESGVHAREWMGPATTLYIMNQFVEDNNRGVNEVEKLLNKFDLYFVPVSNPDGYEFSRLNSSTRLWRKNRRPNNGSQCIGVDLNRNFDVEFGVVDTSKDPCSDSYGGPKAFSEVESQNLRNLMQSLKGRLSAYLAIHAFSQVWLVPYGYTDDKRPSDDAEVRRVAQVATEALRQANGKVFDVGTAGELLYSSSGASDDYAKVAAGAKYTYTVELSPTMDAGLRGFMPLPSEISQSGKGMYAAVKAMLDAAEQ